ncbi:MAG: methyltransferase domain-containing protein, partial [Verrucomicrobia bacterium]|nr:methyltransferase domain-containing protein [Verrucomicrobiota bacterium]
MESSEYQFNRQASLYAASTVHRHGPSLPVLIEIAEPKPTDVVLDVATGTGNTAFALATHVERVTGLDIASGMLAEARSRARDEQVTNIDFIEGSAELLPFPDGHFTLVVSRHAPHHFHHAERFLREVRRTLRPEGRLVIADQISPSAQVSEWIEKWERTRDASHFRQRTIVEWRELT